MKKTEALPGGTSDLSADEELLIRPFKKLKVSSRVSLGEEGLLASGNGPPLSCSCASLSFGHPRRSLRPSRLLASVQTPPSSSSSTSSNEEEASEEDCLQPAHHQRCGRRTKDFPSLIIRRFHTISLSGSKRRKKNREGGGLVSFPRGSTTLLDTPEEEVEEERLEPVNCATQARQSYNDVSVDDLAGYLENSMVFPKKMSYMAEMMYT